MLLKHLLGRIRSVKWSCSLLSMGNARQCKGAMVSACSWRPASTPPGCDTCVMPKPQAALAAAFVVEGLLFAFHLEGSDLNWKAHLLLVLTIGAAAAAVLAEMRAPSSALLGVVRAQAVLLQGVWFMQIAKLLFEGARAPPCRRCFLAMWSVTMALSTCHVPR